MVVVDASVVVKWFVDEDGHLDALRSTKEAVELKAPDMFWQKSRMSFVEKFA